MRFGDLGREVLGVCGGDLGWDELLCDGVLGDAGA
jgi:hypothetical protein